MGAGAACNPTSEAPLTGKGKEGDPTRTRDGGCTRCKKGGGGVGPSLTKKVALGNCSVVVSNQFSSKRRAAPIGVGSPESF